MAWAGSVYIGVESLSLSSEDTVNSRSALPRGIMWAAGVIVSFCLLTTLIVCSAPPGIGPTIPAPLPMVGLIELLFGSAAAPAITGVLAFPAIWANLLGNVHATGRITFSLARAGEWQEAAR